MGFCAAIRPASTTAPTLGRKAPIEVQRPACGAGLPGIRHRLSNILLRMRKRDHVPVLVATTHDRAGETVELFHRGRVGASTDRRQDPRPAIVDDLHRRRRSRQKTTHQRPTVPQPGRHRQVTIALPAAVGHRQRGHRGPTTTITVLTPHHASTIGQLHKHQRHRPDCAGPTASTPSGSTGHKKRHRNQSSHGAYSHSLPNAYEPPTCASSRNRPQSVKRERVGSKTQTAQLPARPGRPHAAAGHERGAQAAVVR